MPEPWDGEILPDREVAAYVGVALAVAGLIALWLLAVAAIGFGIAAFAAGLWAASRGEHAALGSVGVFLGLGETVAGVLTLVV